MGFETYTQLMEEAVRKLQGEEVTESIRTQITLQVDFHVPEDYVPDQAQRLQLYKRLAAVRDQAERDRAAAELEDRYGPLPSAVRNLLEYSLLKQRAQSMRIPLLERRANRLRLRFREDSRIDPQKLMRFVATHDGAQFKPDGLFEIGFDHGGKQLFAGIHRLLDRFVA